METPFSSPMLAGSGQALRKRKLHVSPSCREQVGSSVPTVTEAMNVPRRILGDVKIPHVGSRRSSAQFTGNMVPCPVLAQAVGVVEVRGVFWEVGPHPEWKLLSAATAPSPNEVLVFDHPDPNGSEAGGSVGALSDITVNHPSNPKAEMCLHRPFLQECYRNNQLINNKA